eukprot:s558_g18.t1
MSEFPIDCADLSTGWVVQLHSFHGSCSDQAMLISSDVWVLLVQGDRRDRLDPDFSRGSAAEGSGTNSGRSREARRAARAACIVKEG